MISFPNAKINIGLDIVERRADGMHNLVSAFVPVPGLCDVLEIVPSRDGNTTLTCYGDDVGCPPDDNLVMRAIRLMQSALPSLPPVEAHLFKRIPSGAGLGGGSSDAAAAMTMLNDMAGAPVKIDELAKMAATIGADCPFFIYNTPTLARGIGNEFEPIEMCLDGLSIVLVKPPVHVSTREAYAMVKPAKPRIDLGELVKRPVAEWSGAVKNDFEPSVFAQHPALASIKERLAREGAVYTSMSGSGSAIFGLFDSARMAEEAQKHFDGCFVFSSQF